MFCGNKKTKVVHYQQCRFAGNPKNSGWVGFATLEEAYDNGYRLCNCCSPLIRDLRVNSIKYQNICQSKGLIMNIRRGMLFIGAPHSNWYVRPGVNHKYELFHRNTLGRVGHYHLQRTFLHNIQYILNYIADHEDYGFNNPVEPKVKKHHKKDQPRKGTKRYKSMQKRIKAQKRSHGIRTVLELIERMECEIK